jgi:hypothetical protein
MRHRQGAHECFIHDAEDGRIRADAERERQHRDEGKAGMLAEHPRAIAQVL